MSRAFQLSAFGLENLELVERELPPPSPGRVTVRMRAASLNYRDLLMARGHYDPRQAMPLTPLSDGVGEITAVGEGVTRVAVGDRVAGCFAQRWIAGAPTRDRIRDTLGGPLGGMLAEEVDLSADGVVKVPASLTDAEAATLPCAALTAWSALELAGVKTGETVLVQGTGGVSIFALQLAVARGAEVLVTSSSHDKLARAKKLGASFGLNYREDESWGKTIRKRGGVDHVIEVGGAGTLEQSLKAIKPGGCIAVIGILAGGRGAVNLVPVLMNQIRMQGVLVGHRDGFEAMNRAVERVGLKPVIDRVFPFEEAQDAFTYLASGQHFGKVCVQIADS